MPLWTYVYISLGLYQGMEWLGHIVSVYLIFERSWQFFLQWLCHFTYSSTLYESSCSWRSSQTLGILSRKNCDVLHRIQNFPIVSKNLSKTHSVQFSSVTQLCLILCNTMDRSTAGLPVHHQLPEFTQTHVHCVSDAIQPSHPLSSPSPPALNLSQHLFQWVSSSHQVAKVLEFQLQHQSFQWRLRTDLL